ncbi:hypothetical protein [Muriicola marianensis]|uniref:hypothetical protein n=1 Tax=Muriicola marianensis TaxID=1324801 RepID=UPI00188769C2|nr:hypothetical protein [Muriicola marianensis]
MALRYFFIGFVCFSLLGCVEEKGIDCSLVLCAAGDSINLELISEGQNVISNETYTLENIEVTGATTEELQIKVFPNTQGATTGYLEISSFDWKAGNYNYTIFLGNDFEVDISVTFGVTDYPCCGDRLEIRELTSQNAIVEYRVNSGIFTIILI